MSVVDFAAAKQERTPHWAGECVCLKCRHEWAGVGEIGQNTALECPSCGLPQGVTKYPFAAMPGDLELRCDCGGEAITAYKRNGFMRVKCMACATDLTEAFYS